MRYEELLDKYGRSMDRSSTRLGCARHDLYGLSFVGNHRLKFRRYRNAHASATYRHTVGEDL